MKTRMRNPIVALALVALFTLNLQLSTAHAQGSAFTYQGRLNSGGSPASGLYDFRFRLDADPAGNTILATVTTNAVGVTNGLFLTAIDFGPGFYNGSNYWLEVDVKTNLAGSYTQLNPFQSLTPTPYAVFAITASNVSGTISAAQLSGMVPSANLTGTYGNALTLNNAGNSFTGNGSGLTSVNALTLDGLGAANFWQLTGNAGTTPGVNFLGTKDNTQLFLDVNGSPLLKLSTNNSIVMANGTLGNSPAYNYEVALGQAAKATANGSVAIGWSPTSSGPGSVAIGESVTSSANDSFASGGYSQATAQDATAMGYGTLASGAFSMALGYNAQAVHEGSFVWADDSGGSFSSQGTDEFLIRAAGGVGIGTTGQPQQFLSVQGGMNLDQLNQNQGFLNNGNTNGYGLTFGSGSGEGIASQRQSGLGGNNVDGLDFYTGFTMKMSILNDGFVGIGTQTQILGDEQFGMYSSTSNNFDGMFIGTAAGGRPFYGFSEGGFPSVSWTEINGQQNNNWELWLNNSFKMAVTTNGYVGIGTASPAYPLDVAGEAHMSGLIRSGSETGTSEGPNQPGLVVRRINSTFTTSNSVVARSDLLTLIRDGSDGGLVISYPASPGTQTIAAMGMTSAGAQVNFYTTLSNPGTAGTVQIYSNAQGVHSCQITFGNTYTEGHVTQVNISRALNDYYWVGSVNSTYNQ